MYLIPAVIPLKPAPMTMTFTGLYSSMQKSPSTYGGGREGASLAWIRRDISAPGMAEVRRD